MFQARPSVCIPSIETCSHYLPHPLECLYLSKKITETFVDSEKITFFAPAFVNSKIEIMSRVCQLTGKKVMVGNNVSHSNRKTKRKFYPNLITKKFYLPEEDKYITLKISTSALRTINKNGIAACVKEAREKGYLK
jgi:large subunit ribosomal protein L28